MKRWICLLLSVLLLFSLSAAAEEEEAYQLFESVFGYTMMYPAGLVTPYEENNVALVEFFRPNAADTDAFLACRMVDGEAPSWEEMGYMLVDVAEPEIQTTLPWTYEAFVSEDGKELVEQMLVIGYDVRYLFTLSYPVEDPDEWGDTLRAVLETLEFPPQPAQAGSFRLDFFQGGAAGMRFEDVIVDEEAEPLVLIPLDEVTDFVLEVLTWDDETFTVAQARTLYAAPKLAFGDNLRIRCYFSDVLPNLRVRCVNAQGDEECWYLADSGMDGSLLLLSQEDF